MWNVPWSETEQLVSSTDGRVSHVLGVTWRFDWPLPDIHHLKRHITSTCAFLMLARTQCVFLWRLLRRTCGTLRRHHTSASNWLTNLNILYKYVLSNIGIPNLRNHVHFSSICSTLLTVHYLICAKTGHSKRTCTYLAGCLWAWVSGCTYLYIDCNVRMGTMNVRYIHVRLVILLILFFSSAVRVYSDPIQTVQVLHVSSRAVKTASFSTYMYSNRVKLRENCIFCSWTPQLHVTFSHGDKTCNTAPPQVLHCKISITFCNIVR